MIHAILSSLRFAAVSPKRPKPLSLYLSVWRQRQALRALNRDELEDIGLTREEVEREANRPFWNLNGIDE